MPVDATYACDMAEPTPPRLTTDQVWAAIDRASNAVLGHVTPAGAPRTSAVVYRSIDRRIYVAVAPGSWKDRHIRADGRVSMTILVRRGGPLSLIFPIPPATVTFQGTASVHPADDPSMRAILDRLSGLLPPNRRSSSAIIEITPQDEFLTYGIGVRLGAMRTPQAARSHVPVG
jgi:hypothetical protein